MSAWLFQRHKSPAFCYAPTFSPEECDQIVGYGKTLPFEEARVTTKDSTVWQQDNDVRNCKVRGLDLKNNVTQMVYSRLEHFVQDCNYDYFKYDIYGFAENIQLLEYNVGGKYTKHIDNVANDIVRKFTVVINLTDHTLYEGGELQIHTQEIPTVPPKTIGTAVMFPSHVLHGVTPVTSGTRFSLIAWVAGPPLR
jgi:PKHD-type hydroxylase